MDQVACLRGCKNGGDGFRIAHLPHQNHIGALTQYASN